MIVQLKLCKYLFIECVAGNRPNDMATFKWLRTRDNDWVP